METALVLFSLVIGAIAGCRMLGRAARVIWARFVSNVFVQEAWAWVVAWGAAPEDYEPVSQADTSINTSTYQPPQEQSAAPNVTERAGVIWLAGKKKVDGSWVLSANAIYDLARGNRNEVMAWIREARSEAPGEPQAVTPYAGRPYNPKAYQDDPELAYTAPPK